MAQNDIPTWLQSALKQVAAESYLDGIDWNDPIALRDTLVRGNNRQGFEEQNYTRMSVSQATAFVQKYSIVDHHANDATGVSATLMRERDQNGQLTNNFTLSFRSLEYQNQVNGGDWERDGQGITRN
jgi:hypothetical protein